MNGLASSSMEIDVSSKTFERITDRARKRLKELTEEFAKRVVEEANRVESGRSLAKGPEPEITETSIDQAYNVLRIPRRRRRLSSKIANVLNPLLAAVIVGWFFAAGDRSTLEQSTLVVLLIALVASIVVVVIKD